MKKIWASIYKALKMGLLSYVLLLSTFSGLTGIAVAHPMGGGCILLFCSSTPTPTPNPTPTPTPNPTPTPTPNPTPTSTSNPTPTPTLTSNPSPISTATQPSKVQVRPKPSQVVPSISTLTAGMSPTATTVTVPASASVTVVTVNPNQATVTRTDTIPANQQLPGAADTGSSMLISSLSVGAVLFLLVGAILWFLWRRQRNQCEPGQQGILGYAQASRWISGRELRSNIDVPQYEASTVVVPQVSGGSGVLPLLEGTQSMSSPQSAYAPNNPQPMMNTFQQQMFTMTSNSRTNYPQNNIFRPPLMDSLNQPHRLTETRDSNKDGQMSLLANSPTPLRDTPTQFMPSSHLLPEAPLPSVEDDPMLGTVMRQAQMGLFTLPDR